jgi:iron complex outermembrane receptor protein
MLKLYLTGAASAVLALACCAAHAQTAAESATESRSTQVGELTVTATKREERLIDVPGPITAITGRQINDTRMNEARDLITLIPTAFLQEVNAGSARDINIRGVGTPTLFAEPGVALYNDDVYSNDFISYPTQFYDIERVEVLRGPQGGLYGRDAVGGAVNVISQPPTPDFGGYLRASYGNWERSELEGALNVPINADSGVRILGWGENQKTGQYYNEFLHEWIDKNDSWGTRVVYHDNVTDKLSLNVVGEFQEGDGPGTNLYFPDSGETMTTIQRDTEPRNHFNSFRLSAEANWQTDVGQFTFIGGYRNYWLHGIEDTDLSADYTAEQDTYRQNSVESYYAEARWLSKDIGPVSLMAGISLLDSHAIGNVFSNGAGTARLIGAPFSLTFNNGQSVVSWSPYVEATWHITSTLSFIGDLRYTDDSKHVDFGFTPTPAFTLLVPSFQPASLIETRSFTHFSPGGTLAWEPGPDWRVYAKVQTGFRAGGFNFDVADAANVPYDQETSINYEIGVKRRIPNGYLALTAYRFDQSNVLTPEFNVNVAGSIGSYLANLGSARTYGVELEGAWAPFEGLSLTANMGYLNGKFTSGVAEFGAVLTGNQLPTGRPFTAAATADYRHPLVGDTDMIASAAYSHRDAGWADAQNTFRLDGLDQLNFTAGVDLHHRVEIVGYMENALNDMNIIAFGGFRAPDSTGILRAPGRAYGVQVKAKF